MQLERYVAGTSLIHGLDPRVKLMLTLLVIVSTVVLPDAAWLAFALTFALAAVGVMFTLPGQAVADATVGTLHLTATDRGVARFVSIVIRSWLSVQFAIL